jgi:alpha/beta superfamily hydrolase
MTTLLRAACAALLALCTFNTAFAQDYARERRWLDEVKPGLVVGDAVMIKSSRSNREFLGLYTEVPNPVATIVIVHGLGVHPDHGIIGVLRTRLSELGYNTLSIQMPVLAADAPQEEYARLFPDAADRIARAVDWLKAKGQTNIVLVSHSMGSRMADAYFGIREADNPFRAWVALGMSQTYRPVTGTYRFPMLDVYGQNDLPAVRASAAERRRQLDPTKGSRQVEIEQTDHFYAGQEKALVTVIDQFLRPVVTTRR